MKKQLLLLVIIFISITYHTKAQTAFKVEVSGKGEPVSKHYECHVFTFAGFGGVPPVEKPWLPKIKEEVVEYVHRRKLQHAVIIGHSLGGTLGLWLAATEPTLFKKVIVVDALLQMDGRPANLCLWICRFA